MNPAAKSPRPPVDILIAEDSPTQAQRLRHILEQQGYHVIHAGNGRLALEAARFKKPTLIISDVVMPEMNGYELCRHIKSDAGLKDVPLILVTTLSDPHDVIRGLECHADNFILKPYDEKHLVGRVQFVLANREMRQAEQSSMGVEIFFGGQKHFITADRLQILNLLLSTYEAAMQRNHELSRTQEELRRANAELAAASRAKSDFLAGMSHELRTPLNAVIGFSEVLVDGKYGALNPKQWQSITHILNSGRHLLQLINDVLDLSKVEAGKMEFQPEAFSVRQAVAEVLSLVAPMAQKKNLTMRHETDPAADDVTLDLQKFKQVVLNLLSNAIKFTPDDGRVDIFVSLHGEARIALHVCDTGIGIKPEDMDKLFKEFQQLDSGLARQHPGTGLGLALTKKIVEFQQGTIQVKSEPGKGSTFTVVLPRRSVKMTA